MGTFKETLAEGTKDALLLGPERVRVFIDLIQEEKDRYKVDIRAMNIILQGIPKDIYTLINHYTDTKDIWDNIKMLLEGSELTKDDRESQLYDDFKHFCQIKGETIHAYNVRFTKLINDMRNIKMTMPKMQLNSKFVNNMLPKWSRFITEVKLNKGLKHSNFDQLYAYLKQHEVHANENKMMMKRFTQPTNDPLALVSNASIQRLPIQSSDSLKSSHQPSLADNFQLDSGNTIRIIKEDHFRGTMQKELLELGMQERPQDSDYFKDKMLLMQAQENGEVLDEEQLLFIAGEQVTNFDNDVDDPPEQDLALNVDHVFEADQCDTFDSDVDKAPTTQTMFMTNISSEDPIYDEAGPSYDSDIPSEVHDHDNYTDYVDVHEMQNNVQQGYVVNSDAEYTNISNIIPYDQYVEDNAEQVVQSNVSSVQNDAVMMIIDDMHEQVAQSISVNKQNKVVNDALTSELARYEELVVMYEKRAKFELTKREQKIDEQIRIIIFDQNRKETSLNTELHSVKMQLCSTIDHNKSMKE
ncbi:hypothetical protein Tco_0065063 [Tanacetum coccineum]